MKELDHDTPSDPFDGEGNNPFHLPWSPIRSLARRFRHRNLLPPFLKPTSAPVIEWLQICLNSYIHYEYYLGWILNRECRWTQTPIIRPLNNSDRWSIINNYGVTRRPDMYTDTLHWPLIRGSFYGIIHHFRISRADPAQHGALLYGSCRWTISREKENVPNSYDVLRRFAISLTTPLFLQLNVLLIHRWFYAPANRKRRFWLVERFRYAVYGNSRILPDDVGSFRKLWIRKHSPIYGRSFRARS